MIIHNIIKILRDDNNALTNCTHLSKDLMEYFKTGIIPERASYTIPSTKDFDAIIIIDEIKKENTKYLGIVQSVVCLDNTTIPYIPCGTDVYQTSDGTYDLEVDPVYNVDRLVQKSVSVNEINDYLKNKALENESKVSFGYVSLGRCGKYVDNPGHILVYFSTTVNVWYVDCQLYDGLTKKDKGCIFFELHNAYKFANKNRLGINVFGENVFCIEIGARIQKENTVYVKQENCDDMDFIRNIDDADAYDMPPETSLDRNIEIIPKYFNKKCVYNKVKLQCKECKGSAICEHNRRKSYCKDCKGSSICEHNKQKYRCKDCKGSAICEHNRQKINCKDCKGSAICEHNLIKYICKDCKGTSICEHNRQKSRCKDCKGASICEHNRIRSQCKDCKGSAICKHNRQKSYCKDCKGGCICEHNRTRSQCKDCKGGSICEHDRRRSRCKDCKGGSICEHNRNRTQCKDCKGTSICEHNRQRPQCIDCKGASICEHNRQRPQCKDCKVSTKRKQDYDTDMSKSKKIKRG